MSSSECDGIDTVKAQFKQFDTNKDGTIAVEHVKKVLLNASPAQFTEEEFQVLFNTLYTNKDGRIKYQEFLDDLFGPSPPFDKPKEEKEWAEPVALDRGVLQQFLDLDQGGKVKAEYVWLDSEYTDGKAFDLCSKSLTLDGSPTSVADLPDWAYSGEDGGDVTLVPRRIYRDPFRRGTNIIVLADTYEPPTQSATSSHGAPASWNTRVGCEAVMTRAQRLDEDPWFGIEQEYFLLNLETSWPLGWPKGGYPGKHDAYYCAVGANKTPGKEVVEAHYSACLYAGVKIGGINSEVAPAQWEFQIGPCAGVTAADDLWMARYILQRVCELFRVAVTFDPKPVKGWAGIGCHTNYSTKATRTSPGGMAAMTAQIEKLKSRHEEHIAVYGDGNERRLTGQDDTMAMTDFSYGVADRATSIRITNKCAANDCGYYEDRRPAANMDPYLVTKMLVETTLLYEEADKSSTANPAKLLRKRSKDLTGTPSRPGSASSQQNPQAAR